MIKMIERAIAILDYMYEVNVPLGISQIASDLSLPKATVYRILTTLETAKLIEKHLPSDNYKLGIGFLKYSSKVTSNSSLIGTAKPILKSMSKTLNESVNLSIEFEDYSLNIYKADQTLSNLVAKLIPISPLNCSATGKIFLSQKSEDDIKNYFSNGHIDKRTIHSIVDYEAFTEDIALFNQSGYTLDDEEYEYGLFCVAVPIYHGKRICAAISVTGPKTRILLNGIEPVITILKKSSLAISSQIATMSMHHLI